MAVLFGSVCVTVALLMCVPGGQALTLLRVITTSGDPPSTPTVHCWCPNYPNLTFCSWPESSHSPATQYIVTYSERHSQPSTKQCHLITPGSSSSALNVSSSSSSSSDPSEQLWYCQLSNLRLLTDYIINVTAVYSSGTSSHLASFMMEDIVKPDPPVDVRVSLHNMRNLHVDWSPPPSWADLDIFPLKYNIIYQWENTGTPKSLGPFESTNVELKGLTPGSYTLQVCAMELLGLGQCSNWSSPVNITIPRKNP